MVDAGPNPDLARLSEQFFQVMHSSDPFNATLLGVIEFNSLVPDPSRSGARRNAARFASIESALAAIEPGSLDRADRINHAVLSRLAEGARSDLEHGLWETNASAAGYVSPQAMAFQAVPSARLGDGAAVDGYLERLSRLPGYFDAILARYLQAKADGRLPTRVGVLQAIDQLDRHLGLDLAEDTLLSLPLPPGLPHGRVRGRMAEVVDLEVRPAMQRLRMVLQEELLPVARGDERVGIRFVPGGESGYRAAVRRHTTSELSPEDIHQIGLDRIEDLQAEWAELGGGVLGTTDVREIQRRLRDDPSLRFADTGQIVRMVTDALSRAEAARDRWFPPYEIAPCVIEEISPLEEDNEALAYYRPPSADGSRPGAHCVLTASPQERFVYEYEALAFHESTPGHHLQLASAQTLKALPTYRRFLDTEVCSYIEGWGLYCERLADEMGLYTSDLQRLGMLSFDALRACRLVVDTGMHYFGWPRQQAMDYMWENTATPLANVRNEIDRYIAWPGQALAYMVGCREIRRLRAVAEKQLGARFDIRDFHGVVLGNGAVPLGVLEELVLDWLEGAGLMDQAGRQR
ncbi:MAG: DUF885 domain-containing protein [Candidatus Dormibacteria bacterium]